MNKQQTATIEKFKYKYHHTTNIIGQYISRIWSRISFPYNKLKEYHQRLLQLDVDTIKDNRVSNPYQMLFSWSLETVVTGLATTLVLYELGYQVHWHTPLAMGIGVWLVLDTIERIRERIKG